jgi:tetratricopeptide (TPR) repeat protein/tRNA A-37 threonylcarbamoyl transferase component Bud32
MDGLPNQDATLDLSSTAREERLLAQFETAWREALDGAPPPPIDMYLIHAVEEEKRSLEAKLRSVARDYEQRLELLRKQPAEEVQTITDSDQSLRMEPALPPTSGKRLSADLGATVAQDGASPVVEDKTALLSRSEATSADKTVKSIGGRSGPADANLDVRAPTETVDYQAAQQSHGFSTPIRPSVTGYEIYEELGRGGMGVVYKARQIRLNRLVALKMVLAGAHASSLQLARFYTEAEAVAQLQHPGIVQIYEVGEHDGLPFFSLEFVEGGSLAEKIDRKPQPPWDAARVAQVLTEAMAVAHQHGIIHRDLKPANVLLTPAGDPKITDFGLAKRLEGESGMTKSGTLMGTPNYMSPEQARGENQKMGPLSDLYSLGAILYELLTGKPPFVGPSILETVYMVRHQEPVPPSRLQPKVPRDLETICLKCLQKEPTQRYSECEALAGDLRRFLRREPILARPVGRLERAWRWCRRNPRTALLGSAAAVLFLIVLVGTGATILRVRRDREAVAEARRLTDERLEQATEAVSSGNYQTARDLLRWADPLLASNSDLSDVQDRFDDLRNRVEVFANFKQLLDDARFACRFGSKSQKEHGCELCRRLLALHDQIERNSDQGGPGLPPLNSEQMQLFKEDAFEAFLTAALVVQELAVGEAARPKASQQALEWLNKADQILPGTKALYVYRAVCYSNLGNWDAGRADVERAQKIEPISAVDHFWHGFAEHVRGEDAQRRGDNRAAQEFFRKELEQYAAFLQQRPDHYWGYFNWANCLVQLSDRHNALIGFTSCIRLRPDFPWPYNNRGTVHLRLGEYEQAVADYNAALERNHEYTEAYANRGTAYFSLGKIDSALEDLNQALTLDRNFAAAYDQRADAFRARKQYAEALRDCDRFAALGGDKIQVHVKKAEIYRQMARPEDALAEFGHALDLNNKNVQVYYSRAGLYFASRDYAKARDDYSKVLELASGAVGAADVLRNRAIINWIHLKDFPAAIADFEQLARRQPTNAEPHRCLAALYLARRDYDKALDAAQEAVKCKPKFAEAIWVRAQVYLLRGKLDEALAELDPLLSDQTPEAPETLNVRGDIYRAQGRLDAAAADYRRLIALRPKAPEAYVSLALVYKMQGQPEKAIACYDSLIKADPNAAGGYLRRAEFRRNRGEFDAALADCDAAAACDRDSVLPDLVRASIDASRGQHLAAVERAERALRKAPPDDGHVLCAAATVWSLAAQAAGKEADTSEKKELAGQYADRAAALLARMLDKGYHDLIYPEHNRLMLDPALAAALRHPRVRAMLPQQP